MSFRKELRLYFFYTQVWAADIVEIYRKSPAHRRSRKERGIFIQAHRSLKFLDDWRLRWLGGCTLNFPWNEKYSTIHSHIHTCTCSLAQKLKTKVRHLQFSGFKLPLAGDLHGRPPSCSKFHWVPSSEKIVECKIVWYFYWQDANRNWKFLWKFIIPCPILSIPDELCTSSMDRAIRYRFLHISTGANRANEESWATNKYLALSRSESINLVFASTKNSGAFLSYSAKIFFISRAKTSI
mgnify:CR=1 FL=1